MPPAVIAAVGRTMRRPGTRAWLVAAAIATAGGIAALTWFVRNPGPDQLWHQAQEATRAGQWERAEAEQGVEGLESKLKGPTALILIGDDPVAPAKAITDFAKDHPNDLPAAKGGILQGAVIEADALTRVAKLPAREQLLSELLGVLQGRTWAPTVAALGLLAWFVGHWSFAVRHGRALSVGDSAVGDR